MIPSLSIGSCTLLDDCNHSATAIFWRVSNSRATRRSLQRAIFDTVWIRSTNERAWQNGVSSGPTPFPVGNGDGPASAPFPKATYVLYLRDMIWFKRSLNGVGDVGAGAFRPHFLNNGTRLRHVAPRFANITWGRRCRDCSDITALFLVTFVPATPAHGRWGRRSPPLAALLPRLPPTRRWPVENRARDARLHAATGGGHGRGGEDRGGSHRHGHVIAPPLQRWKSRAPAAAAAGQQAPPPPLAMRRHRAADGGGSAGLGRPPQRHGARQVLGHARTVPPPQVVVAPAADAPRERPACSCMGRSRRCPPRWFPALKCRQRPTPSVRGGGNASAAPPTDGAGAPGRAHPELLSARRRRACALTAAAAVAHHRHLTSAVEMPLCLRGVTTRPAHPTQSGGRRARPVRRVVLSGSTRPGRKPRRAHTHGIDRGKTPRAANTSCVTGSSLALARVEGLEATITPRPLVPSTPRPSPSNPQKIPP